MDCGSRIVEQELVTVDSLSEVEVGEDGDTHDAIESIDEATMAW